MNESKDLKEVWEKIAEAYDILDGWDGQLVYEMRSGIPPTEIQDKLREAKEALPDASEFENTRLPGIKEELGRMQNYMDVMKNEAFGTPAFDDAFVKLGELIKQSENTRAEDAREGRVNE